MWISNRVLNHCAVMWVIKQSGAKPVCSNVDKQSGAKPVCSNVGN